MYTGTMLMKRIKSLDREWEKLMTKGKKLGKAAVYQSEEEVALEITRQRRKREPWRKDTAKYRNR